MNITEDKVYGNPGRLFLGLEKIVNEIVGKGLGLGLKYINIIVYGLVRDNVETNNPGIMGVKIDKIVDTYVRHDEVDDDGKVKEFLCGLYNSIYNKYGFSNIIRMDYVDDYLDGKYYDEYSKFYPDEIDRIVNGVVNDGNDNGVENVNELVPGLLMAFDSFKRFNKWTVGMCWNIDEWKLNEGRLDVFVDDKVYGHLGYFIETIDGKFKVRKSE